MQLMNETLCKYHNNKTMWQKPNCNATAQTMSYMIGGNPCAFTHCWVRACLVVHTVCYSNYGKQKRIE